MTWIYCRADPMLGLMIAAELPCLLQLGLIEQHHCGVGLDHNYPVPQV